MRGFGASGACLNEDGEPWGSWTSMETVASCAGLGTATTLAVLAVQTAAHADIVSNTVVAGGSPTVVAGETTQIGYSIQNQNTNAGDTQNSCNPGDTTAATLTVSKPAAVTVSPASRQFTSCGTTQLFNFSSNTPGSYSISVSVTDAGGGTYLTSGATFTLTVTKPLVVNTPPTVAIGGVTNGAPYEFGNVPIATLLRDRQGRRQQPLRRQPECDHRSRALLRAWAVRPRAATTMTRAV